MRCYVEFNNYAPTGFLIVRENGDPHNEDDTVLVQADYDYPGVASNLGWVACKCGETDGTVDCPHRTATEMISEAYGYLLEHEGELFEDPGYFSE